MKRRLMMALMVMAVLMAMAGSASAGARGYGIVFGGRFDVVGGGIPSELNLPAQAQAFR